jgi:hypothetical protein
MSLCTYGLTTQFGSVNLKNDGSIIPLKTIQLKAAENIDRAVAVVELAGFEFPSEAEAMFVEY